MIKRILVDPRVNELPLWRNVLDRLQSDPRFKIGDETSYDLVLAADPDYVKDHPGAPVLVTYNTTGDQTNNTNLIERTRRYVDEETPVDVSLPLRFIEDAERIIKQHETTLEQRLAASTGESLAGLTAQLRYNLERAENQDYETAEGHLKQARERFRVLRARHLGGAGSKVIIPMGEPGKYTEGGAVLVGNTSLVLKKIPKKGKWSAMEDAVQRQKAAERHKGSTELNPYKVYKPIEVGEEVWLVSEQIRGKTASEILSYLGVQLKNSRDPVHIRQIRNIAEEVIDLHTQSLLYWIREEEGLPTAAEEIRNTYVKRGSAVPKILEKKGFAYMYEYSLWERCIKILFGDIDIPEETIVARRDAVWDNGLIRLDNNELEDGKLSLAGLMAVRPQLKGRYHSIDMGSERDSIVMEIAKFVIAPEAEAFHSYIGLHAKQVLSEVAQFKGFDSVTLDKTTTSRLFAYRAIRKTVLSAQVFPSRAQADYSRWKGHGAVVSKEELKKQIQRFHIDTIYGAHDGGKRLLNLAYTTTETDPRGFGARKMPLERLILAVANGKHRKYLNSQDIIEELPHYVELGRRVERYEELLEKFENRPEYKKNEKAAAALFVASYLHRFEEKVKKMVERK